MKKLFAITALVAMLVLSLGTWAVAQQARNLRADLFHGFGFGVPAGQVSCEGDGADERPADGGFVNVHFNLQRGELLVNVHVRDGLPNDTYGVFIRCVAGLGTLTTNARGVGNGTFTIPLAAVPPRFAIDMRGASNGEPFIVTPPIEKP